MTAEPRLLATCWTTAGTAKPGGESPRSPLTVAERIAALATEAREHGTRVSSSRGVLGDTLLRRSDRRP